MSDAVARCPICRAPAAPRPQNPAAPFCSERCRLVDLGAWLDERYRVPTDEPPSEADLEALERPAEPKRRRGS